MAVNKTVTIINLTHTVGSPKALSVDGKLSNLRIAPYSAVTEDYYNLQLDEEVADLLSGWVTSGLAQVQLDGVAQSSSQVAAWKYSFDFAASTSFDDSTFFIYDNMTPSKKLAFQCSGISASTTRTLTVSDSNGTIALTSDIANTLDDSVFQIHNHADVTKLLAFDCSGISPMTTRTLTIPDASGTIALTSSINLQSVYLGGQTITTTAAGVLSFVTSVTPVIFTVGGPSVRFVSSSGVGTGLQFTYNGPAADISILGSCQQFALESINSSTTSTGGAAVILNASSGGIQLIGNNASSDAIDIDSIGGLDVDVASCNITTTVGISLNSVNTSNFTMAATDAADKTLTIAASNAGAGSGLVAVTADNVGISSTNAVLTMGFNIGALSAAAGVVDSFDPAVDGSVMWVFNVTRTDSAGNMTEYTVNAMWDDSAGAASYRSLKSVDIGSTAGITFNVDMSGATGLVRLNYAITAGTWAVSGTRLINYVA